MNELTEGKKQNLHSLGWGSWIELWSTRFDMTSLNNLSKNLQNPLRYLKVLLLLSLSTARL